MPREYNQEADAWANFAYQRNVGRHALERLLDGTCNGNVKLKYMAAQDMVKRLPTAYAGMGLKAPWTEPDQKADILKLENLQGLGTILKVSTCIVCTRCTS